MNQMLVREQPLLKARYVLKEVGKEQSPITLLTDPAFTFLQ